MISQVTGIQSPISANKPRSGDDQRLREVAKKLEASFLAEMLKAAGMGKPRTDFGGGAGEQQYASFLREQQASAMAQHGGIGLAEKLFNALKESQNAQK